MNSSHFFIMVVRSSSKKMLTSKTGPVSHFRGSVVFLAHWEWSPCEVQKPMQGLACLFCLGSPSRTMLQLQEPLGLWTCQTYGCLGACCFLCPRTFFLQSSSPLPLLLLLLKSLQSCPTLCDPIVGSPPGSSVHGIFQARVLEWGAIAFSAPLPLGFCKIVPFFLSFFLLSYIE